MVVAVAAGCNGRLLGKPYEYEEDLTLALDGSATLVVNASLASLVALRGLAIDASPRARLDNDAIRAAYGSPVTDVQRVSRPWTRAGRRFVQIRLRVSDIRRLHEVPPFAWSHYTLTQADGRHVFQQTVGASALRPGTLQNVGWNGSELVAFRLHLPSRIVFHNSRDIETNTPEEAQRGNILGWEQQLTDRLDGTPIAIKVEMESQSILYRTLWLFAGAFAAAMSMLALLIWWARSKGAPDDATSPPAP